MVAIQTKLSEVPQDETTSVSPTVATASSKRSTKSSKSVKSIKSTKSSSPSVKRGGDASVASLKSKISMKAVISSLSKRTAKSVAPSTTAGEDQERSSELATIPSAIETVTMSEARDDISVAHSFMSVKSDESAAAISDEENECAASVAASVHSTKSVKSKSDNSTAAAIPVEGKGTASVAASARSTKSHRSAKSIALPVLGDEDATSVAASARSTTSHRSSKSVKSSTKSTAVPVEDEDATSVAASARSTKSHRSTRSSKSTKSPAVPVEDEDTTSVAASVHSTKSHRSWRSAKSTKSHRSSKSAKSEEPGEAGDKEDVAEKDNESVAAASVRSTASRKSEGAASVVVADDASEALLIGNVHSIESTPSLLFALEAGEDDDKSATTETSEAKARRMLRLYGFGAGMRMYRKSLEQARKEQKQATQQLTQVTEEETGQLEGKDSMVRAEDRDEQITDILDESIHDDGADATKSVNSSVFEGMGSVPSATKEVKKEEIIKDDVEVLSRTATDCEPVVEVETEQTKDSDTRTDSLDELVLSFFRNMCGLFSTIDEIAKDVCRQGEKLSSKEPVNLLKLECADKDQTLDSMLEDIGETHTSTSIEEADEAPRSDM